MLSTRSAFDLAPNALARALEARGDRPLLDLTESNPTRAGIPYDVDSLRHALGRPENARYEPRPFGLPAAREAVARELSSAGPVVDAGRVALTASTSEAYSFLFKLLCDPGDEVLVPAPSYPLFAHLAQLESVVAIPYRLVYEGGWHLDVPSMKKAVTDRTRAVVAVSPNNPTGSFLKKAELDAVVATGLPVVSDEVFGRYSLRDDPSRMTTVLEAAPASLLFSLGGLSKLAALPQMKLGWIAVGGAKELVDDAMGRLEVIADAFLSVGAPVQNAAAALLASRETAEGAIKARTRDNLFWLAGAVKGTALTLLDVEGGWYATLRLPRTRSEEAWTLSLLAQDDVHVHPGHYFDFEEEAYVVVSLLTPEATFREGVRRIVERVRRDA
jgi:aspartate/methionine/tyrosine aminotransferase